MITLKQLWVAYRKEHVPPAASYHQCSQTEQAFYAGASQALFVMFSDKLTPTAEDADKLLQAFRVELTEYAKLRAAMLASNFGAKG